MLTLEIDENGTFFSMPLVRVGTFLSYQVLEDCNEFVTVKFPVVFKLCRYCVSSALKTAPRGKIMTFRTKRFLNCIYFVKNALFSLLLNRHYHRHVPPEHWSWFKVAKEQVSKWTKLLFARGAKLWNSLPAESKTASSPGGFKKSIQGWRFSLIL